MAETTTRRFAYVTLLLNSGYLPGSLALAKSLRDSGSTIPLILLLSKSNIPFETYNILTSSGYFERIINIDSDLIASKAEERYQLDEYLKRSDLHLAMSKLNVWRLTDYDRIVYLDSDMLVRGNIDNLFNDHEQELKPTDIIAASDSGWPDIFNSGLFIIKPSIEVFEKLHTFHRENNSFDGADQGLLNEFFNLRGTETGGHWYRLPFTYNCTLNSNYEYLPALIRFQSEIKVFHFIGLNKPWKNYNFCFNPTYAKIFNGGQNNLYALWWNTFQSIQIDTASTSYTGIRLLEASENLQRSFADLSLQKEREHNHDHDHDQHQHEHETQQTQFRHADPEHTLAPLDAPKTYDDPNRIPNPFQLQRHAPAETPTETHVPSTPHFPTFYYKKPNKENEEIRDQTKNGEAWKMEEGKFQWPNPDPPAASAEILPPAQPTPPKTEESASIPTDTPSQDTVTLDDASTAEDTSPSEDTIVDKYVQTHPIFPWEVARSHGQGVNVSRTFSNAVRYSPPAYSISVVHSPLEKFKETGHGVGLDDDINIRGDGEDDDDDDNLVGFEDGDKFHQYLQKIEEAKAHKRNDSSASLNVKVEMTLEDQFETDLEKAEHSNVDEIVDTEEEAEMEILANAGVELEVDTKAEENALATSAAENRVQEELENMDSDEVGRIGN
jgi:glycogenin glucosyltransferase